MGSVSDAFAGGRGSNGTLPTKCLVGSRGAILAAVEELDEGMRIGEGGIGSEDAVVQKDCIVVRIVGRYFLATVGPRIGRIDELGVPSETEPIRFSARVRGRRLE